MKELRDPTPATRLTRRQSAVLGIFTGNLCGDFEAMHEYAEELAGRPVWTHELPDLADELKEKAKAEFMAICYTKDT